MIDGERMKEIRLRGGGALGKESELVCKIEQLISVVWGV